MAVLTFPAWTPDQPAYANPGMEYLLNAVPQERGYGPWRQQAKTSSTVGATVLGMAAAVDGVGNGFNFAGTQQQLLKRNGLLWEDVGSTTSYSLAASETWDFAVRANTVYAASAGHTIQKFSCGSDSAFSAVSGTAPQARTVAMVRSFLLAGNTYDVGDGAVPNRVWWSAIGNPEGDWTPSLETLAGYRDIVEGGWVQAVVGGEYGVIFSESVISRLSFVGAPVKFQLDVVERDRGTPAPRSVVRIGAVVFYLGIDGFYRFDGSVSEPIGRDRVDRTFYADVDQSYLHRVVGAADPRSSQVFWIYPGTGNTNGTPNKIMVYNWSQDRWGYVEQTCEWIGLQRQEGQDMDTDINAYGSMDTAVPQISLDAKYWAGGGGFLAAFNDAHEQVQFTGDTMTAVAESSEVQMNPSRKTLVQMTRPICEGSVSAIAVNVGTRERLGDPLVDWQGYVEQDSLGDCPVLSSGRFHRFRVKVAGEFSHLTGVEVEGDDDGDR